MNIKRLKPFFYSLILSFLLFASVDKAHASRCFSLTEAEAEQGIRIHSELMVISLNCQHLAPSKPQTLYQRYRSFTGKHQSIFANYEQTLINYFNKSGGNSEKKMNALRTGFANKISKDAATMRPDLFCSNYAPRIQQAEKMNTQDLRRWASTFFESHPPSRPICNAR